jgi:hypothetical protein
MKVILLASWVFLSWTASGESFISRIHSLEGSLVKFDNGRVGFRAQKRFSFSPGDWVNVNLDQNSFILFAKPLPPSAHQNFNLLSLSDDPGGPPIYEPTVVPDMSEAWKIFHRFNSDYKRTSECSDRAHIWSHDEFNYSGTKSMKAFVFFTDSYIKSVRLKWWFHVAPMYKVNNRGIIQDMVMDFRYTNRPMTVKEWTDQFVYTKRSCKVTTKFSEYDVNPQTENCYLIFESMHYKLPGEIHEQELSGRYKKETTEFELRASFQSAFGP